MIRFLCLLLMLGLPARAELALPLPAGARETARVEEAAARYLLPTARFTPDHQPGLVLEGRVLIRAWRMPLDASGTLPLYRALRQEVEAAGYRILHDCSGRLCGGYDFALKARILPRPEMALDLGAFHYLSAASREAPERHLGLLVSQDDVQAFVQLTDIAPDAATAVTLEPPAAAPGPIADELARNGRAVLEGISFAAGEVRLAEGSGEALQAVADLLAADSALALVIVGHSDNSGTLAANVQISERRARAVLEALVRDYGVDPERLEAAGVGFLAPLTANTDDATRLRNRRVEIVAR
ncbi:OmpA family protein [Algicella marina]|uniref:OmpA family protein n=1 Tax=Algicella marina TaxID=2683284 RepID=A0A6P1T2D6_9RHOB|nr:OmpA family protein [Algicella marina]QHQ36878.1 OmpA family protein [Algicella marina]